MAFVVIFHEPERTTKRGMIHILLAATDKEMDIRFVGTNTDLCSVRMYAGLDRLVDNHPCLSGIMDMNPIGFSIQDEVLKDFVDAMTVVNNYFIPGEGDTLMHGVRRFAEGFRAVEVSAQDLYEAYVTRVQPWKDLFRDIQDTVQTLIIGEKYVTFLNESHLPYIQFTKDELRQVSNVSLLPSNIRHTYKSVVNMMNMCDRDISNYETHNAFITRHTYNVIKVA